MAIFKVARDCKWQLAPERNRLLRAIVRYEGVAVDLSIYGETGADGKLGDRGPEPARLICHRRYRRAVAISEVVQIAGQPYFHARLWLTVDNECALDESRGWLAAKKC